jgi:hypothetical protein
MDLDSILKRMEQTDEQQKVASAQTSVRSPEAEASALAGALEKAAGAPPKQSTGDNAVADLLKMAEKLAGTEQESELVHAAMLGQAFADAAINKFAAYDAQVKIAMAQDDRATDAELQKTAAQEGYNAAQNLIAQAGTQTKLAEDDQLIKEAAELGYKYAQEKVAEEYKLGYDNAMLDVRNTAANEFIKGAQETAIMINHHRQQSAQR